MVEVDNVNLGYVGNWVATAANTGHNWNFWGDSDTGDAQSTANVSTTMNHSSTTVVVSDSGMGPLAANVEGDVEDDCNHARGGCKKKHHRKPGPVAMAMDVNAVDVDNTNMGAVVNDVSTAANTGLNMTVGGESDTGDATADSTVVNDVNGNETYVQINDTSGGPTAVNTDGAMGADVPCVGPIDVCGSGGPTAANIGEEGTAVAVDADVVEVDNTNAALVVNDVDTAANTGGNVTIDCGDDPCDDDNHVDEPACHDPCDCDPCDGDDAETNTGDAEASSTVENTVNTNSTTVVITD
jgi:hypothetical protein